MLRNVFTRKGKERKIKRRRVLLPSSVAEPTESGQKSSKQETKQAESHPPILIAQTKREETTPPLAHH